MSEKQQKQSKEEVIKGEVIKNYVPGNTQNIVDLIKQFTKGMHKEEKQKFVGTSQNLV